MIQSRQWKVPHQKKSGRKSTSNLLYAQTRLQLVSACCIVAGYCAASCSSDRGQRAAAMSYTTGLQKWTHCISRVASAELCTGIETSAGSASFFCRHLSLNGLPSLQHMFFGGGALLYERRAYLRGKQVNKLFELHQSCLKRNRFQACLFWHLARSKYGNQGHER